MAGKSALHQKENEAARRYFETVIDLDPTNPEGYYQMGRLQLAEKNQDDAIEYLNKALDLNPHHMEAFTNLIIAYTIRKDITTALSFCDSHLSKVSTNPRSTAVIQNLKGVLFLEQKETSKAESQFKEALVSDPNYLPPYYALARLYLDTEQANRAVEQFQNALEKNPKQTAAHMFLGMIYESIKDPELAERHYRSALVVDPGFVPAANNLAYLLADQNRDLNEALKLATLAKKSNPDDPGITDTLGWVYYKRGLYANAVNELSFAAGKLPKNATVRYHLGMSYFKNGENEKARQELEKALSLDKSFNGAEEAEKVLAGL